MGSDSDDGKGILRRIPKGLAKFLIFVVALTLSFQATSYFFFTSDAVDNQPRARKLAAGDPIPGTCNGMVKTELGGTILKKGVANLVDHAADCCGQCKSTRGCNIWVWCGDPVLCPAAQYRTCWLKQQTIVKGQSLLMTAHNSKVPYTSGWLPIYSEPQQGSAAVEVAAAATPKVVAEDGGHAAAAADSDVSCHVMPNSDLAGHVVKWGTSNLVDSAEQCCESCRAMPDCNIWVWCGDAVKCPASMHRSCWLKNQTLYKDLPPGVMASGEKVPWTGGWLPRYSHLPKGDELGFKTRAVDITVKAGPDHPVRPRECGQPAIDGYAHVKPECLEKSRTAREFDISEEARMKLVVWIEEHASYDGLAVGWGIGHKKPTAEACADACRRHVPDTPAQTLHGGPFGKLPCNAWVWCPVGVKRCFEPDAHTHTGGDCWLKFTEVPEAVEVNARGAMDDPGTVRDGVKFKERHKDAHDIVPWVSGVLLPEGVVPTNGTWGPRAQW